jgi:23S rRNA (adenine1618-N6)-methyltransferase
MHYIADLIASSKNIEIEFGNEIKCLDIGVGANCIYPMIGVHEYGWQFVGSDIDQQAIKSAALIIKNNASLVDYVQLFHQRSNKIFEGVIDEHGPFHITLCNPPFFTSALEAKQASQRKVRNLSRGKNRSGIRNFGGQRYELWCTGGERKFVTDMINESQAYKSNVHWFTTLLSQNSNLTPIQQALKKVKPSQVNIIPMSQGNKISRIVAWTFL